MNFFKKALSLATLPACVVFGVQMHFNAKMPTGTSAAGKSIFTPTFKSSMKKLQGDLASGQRLMHKDERSCLSQAENQSSSNAQYLAKAMCYNIFGVYRLALGYLHKVRPRSAPHSSRALFQNYKNLLMGNVEMGMQQYSLSRHYYKQVSKGSLSNKDWFAVKYNLGLAWLKEAEQYRQSGSYLNAISAFNQAYILTTDHLEKAGINQTIGYSYMMLGPGHSSNAVSYLKKSPSLTTLGTGEQKAQSYSLLGYVYLNKANKASTPTLDDYTTAISYMTKCAHNGNTEQKATAYLAIGSAYMHMAGNFSTSDQYYTDAIVWFTKALSIGNSQQKAVAYQNMGLAYMQKAYAASGSAANAFCASAISNFKKAVTYDKNQLKLITSAYYQIGLAYVQMATGASSSAMLANYNLAIKYFKKAMKSAVMQNNKALAAGQLTTVATNLAKKYMAKGKAASSTSEKTTNYTLAIKYYKDIPATTMQAQALQNYHIGKAYFKMKDYNKAQNHLSIIGGWSGTQPSYITSTVWASIKSMLKKINKANSGS